MNARILLTFRSASITALTALGGHASAQIIAESRFDSSNDGWLAVGDATSIWPFWNAGYGQSGGGILITDANSGGDQEFSAPPKFIRGLAAAEGGTLSFAIRKSSSGDSVPVRDVFLLGGGLELTFNLPTPETVWRTRTVPLVASSWKIGRDGPPPTPDQFRNALATASGLWIRAEFSTSDIDVVYLDNVVLTAFSNCVAITQQPRATPTQVGGTIHLTVVYESAGPAVTFQWRRDGIDLVDSATVQGSHEPVLVINGAALSDGGVYTCLVSNSCGSVTTAPAAVMVHCPSDIDDGTGRLMPDGFVTGDDFDAFVAKFFEGC